MNIRNYKIVACGKHILPLQLTTRTFALRRGWIFYTYKDLKHWESYTGAKHWWPTSSPWFENCLGTYEEANRALHRLLSTSPCNGR